MDSREPDESRAGIPHDAASGGPPPEDTQAAGAPEQSWAEPRDRTPAPAPGVPLLGVDRLSTFSRLVIGLALAAAAALVTVYLGIAFLHVAPSNTLSKRHSETIDRFVYPEFEQNWRLFAPNPLQTNIHVEVRAQLRLPDGATEETGWVDLTKMDHEDIAGNPAPSHTQQNELRRGWDFWVDTHDEDNKPVSDRAELAEDYVKRIVMRRLGPVLNGGKVQRIQVRQASYRVAPPPWSAEEWSTDPAHRELPWWLVTADDLKESDRERWEEASDR